MTETPTWSDQVFGNAHGPIAKLKGIVFLGGVLWMVFSWLIKVNETTDNQAQMKGKLDSVMVLLGGEDQLRNKVARIGPTVGRHQSVLQRHFPNDAEMKVGSTWGSDVVGSYTHGQ